MRNRCLFLSLVVLVWLFYLGRGAAQSVALARQLLEQYMTYDVEHYQFEIVHNVEAKKVLFDVTITLRDVTAPKQRLSFLVGAFFREEYLERTEINGKNVKVSLRRFFGPIQRLSVRVSDSFSKNSSQRTTLRFVYHIPFGIYETEGRPSLVASSSELYLLPRSFWYPQMPNNAPSFQANVKVPKGMYLAGNSSSACNDYEEKDKQWIYKFGQRKPSTYIAIIGREVSPVIAKFKNYTICAMGTGEEKLNLERLLSTTRQILQKIGHLYGVKLPKRWNIVGILPQSETNYYAGLPGLIYYEGNVNRQIAEGVDIKNHGLLLLSLAHEASHLLFGGWIALDVFLEDGSAFLAESFAEYSAQVVLESLYGEGLSRRLRLLRLDQYMRTTKKTKDTIPMNRLTNLFPQWSLAYSRGAFALHEARRRMGRKAFLDAVREYVHKNVGRMVTFSDFKAIFHKPLGALFDALFHEVPKPDSRISRVHVGDRTSTIAFRCGGLEQQTELFLIVGGKEEKRSIPCAGKEMKLTISGKVERAVVNYNFHAFDVNIYNNVWPAPWFLGAKLSNWLEVQAVKGNNTGLEKGDRIVSIDGHPVTYRADLLDYLLISNKQKITITWIRKSSRFDEEVSLTHRPIDALPEYL